MRTANERFNCWVMNVPVLAVEHLTQATLAKLKTGQPGFTNPVGIYAVPMPEGVMVFCSDESELDGLPDDLRACLAWSIEQGYEWTRFDPSGSPVDELARYEVTL